MDAETLKERALRNLTNTAVITDDVIAIAAEEADEICSGRVVPLWSQLDIAMYRLKVNLKIGISDSDEFSFKEAMKEVRLSPAIDSEETGGGRACVKQGENTWL